MNRLFLWVGLFFLCGCATMSAVSVPGNTTASLTLRADISKMINMVENAQAPGCSHKIVDTKIVGTEGDAVNEEWIVESCGKNVVYPVKLIPDPSGGTYFSVLTPGKGRAK